MSDKECEKMKKIGMLTVDRLLEDMHCIRSGVLKITKQQFYDALHVSIGANKHYADGCWIDFQDSPMHYMCSRSPQSQSKELIKVCYELGSNNK